MESGIVSNAAASERGRNERASWIDIGLLLLVAVFAMWGIGSYGLYEPHEAQYGGGASEMVQRGDWVTPYLNGERELNKPPLFYWLIATSFLLFSKLGLRPEFIARLPAALVALGGVVLAWQWARELWGLRAGRFAALMLAVSTGWYIFAHQLLIDETLSVLILASVYCLWKAICLPAARWPLMAFYACTGLAVLAKGLPGLFFPLAIAGLFVLMRRDWKRLREAKPLMGMLIIACVVGPWAWLYEAHNPGALRYIVVNEHLKRIFDRREPHDYGGVQVSAAVFLMYTIIWCTPWSFVLPQMASFSIESATRKETGGTPAQMSDAVLLLSLAAILPTVFFLPIPSRLIYYAMPTVPPVVILCAGFWSSPSTWGGWKRTLAWSVIGFVGVACVGSAYFLPGILESVPDLEVAPDVSTAIPFEALVAGFVLIGGAVLIKLRKERVALLSLALLMAALEIFNVSEFSSFDVITSSKKMVETLAPKVGDDCIWISENSDEVGSSAGTAFYLRQNTSHKTANILIMGDDPRRPVPIYPGPPLNFFIDQKQLDEIWTSGKPALFITDFKRTDWDADTPHLPSKDCRLVPLPVAGHRHVYANSLAWERLVKAGFVADEKNTKDVPANPTVK